MSHFMLQINQFWSCSTLAQTKPIKVDDKYSRCPKSERLVLKTKQNLVRILDIRISDIRAVQFVWAFGYTINVWNPNVWLVELINRTSEIQAVWEWDNFGKHRNTNVRISDIYCKRYKKIFL